MSLIDPKRAQRALTFLGERILWCGFSPAGEEECLSCTRDDEPTSSLILFLHSAKFGQHLGSLLPQMLAQTHAAEMPLPWCESCAKRLVTSIVFFMESSDRSWPSCFGCEGGGPFRPIEYALAGMAIGLVVVERVPLCSSCDRIFRTFPDPPFAPPVDEECAHPGVGIGLCRACGEDVGRVS
jgi:hypothetical protein